MSQPGNEAGLHEYVDAEVIMADQVTPPQEAKLREILQEMKGVREVSVSGKKVSINYEPTELTEKKLMAAIQNAGLRIAEEHVAPSSPMTDAFAEAKPASSE